MLECLKMSDKHDREKSSQSLLKNVRQRVYSLAAVCMGQIVRNQENRALEYRVSLLVPSSRGE